MIILEFSIILCVGLIFGSFSTALIYRVPRKLPWGAVRSCCPACQTPLGVFDLIPVFSWLLSKGRCRHCSQKISFRYPLIEVICALLCLGAYAIYGFSFETAFLCLSVPLIVSLFIIDWQQMILPNVLVLNLFILGLIRILFYVVYMPSFSIVHAAPYLIGALVYAGTSWFIGFTMTKVLKRDSLGFGDVKFFAVSGLWLGLSWLPYFMMISGGLAIAFSLAWRQLFGKDVFPFGPALITTFYSILLFQGVLAG